ncbi:MAG: hypothetical protein WBE79_03095 [Candidatus Cybelea sp.]
MKIARPAFYAVSLSVLVGALAGCGSQPQPMSFSPGVFGQLAAERTAPLHVDHRKSWVSPEVARLPRILFVSDDSTNDVLLFSMPDLTLRGTLTGFDVPQGLCSDTSGNIWVTNMGTLTIVELARSGTVIKVLTDPDGYPVACAVDPTSGDLAVANIYNKSLSGSGEVEIYKAGGGTPTSLANPDQYYYNQVGYVTGDGSGKNHARGNVPSGNLFVDGRTYGGSFILSELPLGTSAFRTINLSGGTIYFPGMVQWYTPGNYLAVGDQLCGDVPASCIYHVKISGKTGKIKGHTSLLNYLGGSVCDFVQGVIGANGLKYVAGGDSETCGYANSSVNRWAYPAGGTPTNFNDSVVTEPVGAAISTK